MNVIKTLDTANLLALYNALTKKSTSKFASREKGEAQTLGAAKVAGSAEVNRILAELGVAVAPMPKSVADLPTPTITPKTVIRPKGDAKAAPKPKADPKPKVTIHRHVDDTCPLCGAEASAQTAAGKEGTVAGDDRNFCHSCGKEYWVASGKEFARAKPGKDVGAAISRSWLDADVRAARSTRNGVMAGEQGEDQVEYRSVAAAFTALRLPMSKHIKFRGALKAKGKMTFDNGKKIYTFKLLK